MYIISQIFRFSFVLSKKKFFYTSYVQLKICDDVRVRKNKTKWGGGNINLEKKNQFFYFIKHYFKYIKLYFRLFKTNKKKFLQVLSTGMTIIPTRRRKIMTSAVRKFCAAFVHYCPWNLAVHSNFVCSSFPFLFSNIFMLLPYFQISS